MTRPIQHDAHVRAAIVRHDVFLPSATLARIGLADSSEHELDMVSWNDVAAEWDLDRETAEALLAEARAGLDPLQPPPAPNRLRHSFLALAQRLGALSPTDRVQAQPERMQQWLDRLLLAGSRASRLGPEHPDTRTAVAEADRYSGRLQPPQACPRPCGPADSSTAYAPISATLASASPRGVL